jgi:hypothetical protein
MKPNQVLRDPTGGRARIVNVIGLAGIIIFSGIAIAVVSGFFAGPAMNAPAIRDTGSEALADGGARPFDPEPGLPFSAPARRALAPDAAGPLAAQHWFESKLAGLQKTLDPSKLIVGIGSMACDYARPGYSKTISVPNAWRRLRDGGIELKFDQKNLNPRFRFADASGRSPSIPSSSTRRLSA